MWTCFEAADRENNGCATVADKFHWPRMRSPADFSPREKLLHAILLMAGLAPIALMLATVLRLWLPLPYWDEWSTPAENLYNLSQGKLTFTELFSQHNESRKLFPRLLYLGLAQLGGWDVRKEMTITFLIVCAIAFLFYRLLSRTAGASKTAALLAWIAAAFLCFSPVQLENFLWGVQLEVFFPGLAVLALIAINLSALPLGRKGLLNGLLAFVATYTVAHGMLLWLLGIPLLASGEKISRRRRFFVYATYALAAAAALIAYFLGYQRPRHHPEFLAGHPGALKLAHYLILWVGSYFNSAIANPFVVGLAAILLVAFALLGGFWVIRKQGAWRAFFPGFILAAYACATAAITAIGRIGFGVDQALDVRYQPYSLFLYLALIALLFALYCTYFRNAASGRRRLFTLGCALVALDAMIGWLGCFRDGLRAQVVIAERNRSLMRALEWIEVIPDNPKLRTLFPLPDTLLPRIRVMRQHGILRLPFVSERLAMAARETPQPRNGDPFGQLETCFINSDRELQVAGRAQIPDRAQPPDCIIIGASDASGVYKPVSILETTRPRGGGKAKGPKDQRLLFAETINPSNLPPGDVTISAWAVDLQRDKLYPLAGITFIPAGKR